VNRIAWALTVFLVSVGALEAQARPTSAACEPLPPDSAHVGDLPVFRACEVDRPARLRRSSPPRVEFPEDVHCLTADLAFIVDAQGTPIVSTAVVLSATTPEFAFAMLKAIAGWEYVPAQRAGSDVQQLVVERITRRDQRIPFVVVRPGERPPPRPPSPPCR
jgi:hypothetical protein